MKTLAAIVAVLFALPVLAQDKTTGDYLKKGLNSNTSKNAQAQALSKLGVDFTPSPAGARVYFIEPKNGAEVKGPVKVLFGLSGMGIAPAGTQKDNTGHHHLLIDGPKVETNAPLPVSDQIVHFGGGQTETTITLKPGKHSLQLLLGDWKHQPHNPPVTSETITITVK